MYKVFILAASIAFLPLTKHRLIPDGKEIYPLNNFHFTSSFPEILQPASKKNSEPFSQNWLATARENIRKAEYDFTWEEKYHAYCTPNRKQNLRFFYTKKGFVVEPGRTKIPVGDIDPTMKPGGIQYRYLPNWKVNFNLDTKQFGKGEWQVIKNKAAYIAGRITVQYINNDEGMRQNFIVYSPLSNNAGLTINFSIKTTLKTYLHGNQLQFYHKKTNVLNYDQLAVWDADGKRLNASFKKRKKNSFYIAVDTKQARYPITIDPLSSTPNSTPDDANQANAFLGISVATAGDVNGDGYSDVIIGANGYDDGANTDEGRAFVYHGSSSGLSASPGSTLDDANQASSNFGQSVSTAADVNGDGYSDVIVGAPYYNDGANTNEGRAFVYHGSAAGLSASPNSIPDDANQAGAFFGYAVSTAGDVNADGYSDIVIGAPQYDAAGFAEEGHAWVYHGSAAGIPTTPTRSLFGYNPDQYQDGEWFGNSVGCAGDVNGDGYSDIIIGAYRYTEGGVTSVGLAFVYHGSATSVPLSPNTPLFGAQANAFFGFSVNSAGDVNGDGYSDVIVGAYFYDDGVNTNEGRAFVFHGSGSGVSASANSTLDDANQANANFGVSVACAGDINGDGYSDVIVGAYNYDDGANTDEGRAFVYHGSSTGLSSGPISTPGESNQAGARFGYAVASAGDVNGDGYSDVIIGAWGYDDGANLSEGRAFVYHGGPASLSAAPGSTPDDSNQAGANFGNKVALAGDVNGDGYSDIIIGAYQFDDGANLLEGRAYVYHGSATGLSASPNSTLDDANQASAQFGYSVAAAGDVNGDGYADVIVGAVLYTDGANTGEGRAFVYHGSAAGLAASPNNTPNDADQASAQFGSSVACAGDINSDGYSDVIIGAPYYNDGTNTDEGRAFVYHGSALGLNASPSSTPDDANQATALFGHSVSYAGDVNGDGFADVIIGAYLYDDGVNTDEGRAFVYHGSNFGLSSTPNNTPDDANQAGAYFGYSVASAGDVNGDGDSDVIIGAPEFDDGANAVEGRAFVYHGSGTGLSATANSTLDDANQADARFGISVSTAGDVNGDGYSDVIVGANTYNDGANTDEGCAFIYHGSSAGLSAAISNTPNDANQANARFGVSVSSAGDINGDGYSDVIIGANLFDDGANTNEGRAYLYTGNESSANERNNLRLYNTDLVTPINSSNFYNGNFGVGLFAKSFLGRMRGKLVWETRLNFNAYSGNPITNSTAVTSQQASYSNLGINGTELKNQVSKILASTRYTKIRARVKYNPATAFTGQVYGPWRYVSAVIDGNSMGALPIELVSFKAAWIQKGKTARVDFTTDKETGICCFYIEKSGSGLNFFTIGSMPATNSASIQQYSFTDSAAFDKSQFYRLKIMGMNGQVAYSNIQQLQQQGSTGIMVFPNPTTDVLKLELNGNYNFVSLQITNSGGQVVKRMERVRAGNQFITIPVQNLAPGPYWLLLQSNGERQVLRFIKE